MNVCTLHHHVLTFLGWLVAWVPQLRTGRLPPTPVGRFWWCLPAWVEHWWWLLLLPGRLPHNPFSGQTDREGSRKDLDRWNIFALQHALLPPLALPCLARLADYPLDTPGLIYLLPRLLFQFCLQLYPLSAPVNWVATLFAPPLCSRPRPHMPVLPPSAHPSSPLPSSSKHLAPVAHAFTRLTPDVVGAIVASLAVPLPWVHLPVPPRGVAAACSPPLR